MSDAVAPSFELLARVRRIASDAPDHIAYVESSAGGRALTYGQLAARTNALSSMLATCLRPGDVVLLRCGNRIDYPIWFLALMAAGADVAPVSTELTETELRQVCERTGASAVVADDATRQSITHLTKCAWPVEAALDTFRTTGGATTVPGNLLLASSGTTGVPKVVRRSSRSLDAVARNMVEALGFTSDDRVLAAVPLTHSYGVEHGLLAPLWAGATVCLCEGFDLPAVVQTLAGGATVFPAVPSMIEMLANVGDPSLVVPKLRVVYSAGGPLPPAVARAFETRFGLRVGQVYGMTEIGSVTFASPSSPLFDPASVGQPMRDVSIRVLDVHPPHAALPTAEEGEVGVNAPSMFDGYLTDNVPRVDGHFRTGDLGRLDANGNLTITGRVRLLIDAGGKKVNPTEVESVINSHPEVLECVVVPVRQTATVQRLRAVIVPRHPASPPAGDDIRRFARQRLAGYKVPRVVEFRASLPRGATGKIQRRLVEES